MTISGVENIQRKNDNSRGRKTPNRKRLLMKNFKTGKHILAKLETYPHE